MQFFGLKICTANHYREIKYQLIKYQLILSDPDKKHPINDQKCVEILKDIVSHMKVKPGDNIQELHKMIANLQDDNKAAMNAIVSLVRQRDQLYKRIRTMKKLRNKRK